MRVLVIGGTRFIGLAAVRCLQAQGHELTLFHRGLHEPPELPERIPHLHGDRLQLADFTGAIRLLAPQVVLDTAAYTEADARTAAGTLAGIAGRLVVLSSMDVYRAYGRLKGLELGPPDPVPLGEDAPLRESRYPDAAEVPEAREYDNILVERAAAGHADLPCTILRLPAVYGPHDYQHRLRHYLRRMDDGRPAILLDTAIARWRWTRGYSENVAAAIALAVGDERAAGRTYNVGEAVALTEEGWVRAIGRAAGWDGQVHVLPPERLPAAARWWDGAALEHELYVDTTRLRAELGYVEPLGREEGLRRAVAWERANPPAEPPAMEEYEAEDAVLRQLGA